MRRLGLLGALAAALAAAPLHAQPSDSAGQEIAPQSAAANEAQVAATAAVVQRALDAWRAGDFEGWIANFAPEVIVITDGLSIEGREQLREVYGAVFDAGVPASHILESGWADGALYVRQREFLPDGTLIGVTYGEYTVANGQITSVFGRTEQAF